MSASTFRTVDSSGGSTAAVAFGTDRKYPESDHAPVVATFQFD